MADGPYTSRNRKSSSVSAGGGGTQRLTRLLGAGKALHMCLRAPRGPGGGARVGLVDRVVAPERLLEEPWNTRPAWVDGQRPAPSPSARGSLRRLATARGTGCAGGWRFLSAISTPESIEAERAHVERTKELGHVPIVSLKSSPPSSSAEGRLMARPDRPVRGATGHTASRRSEPPRGARWATWSSKPHGALWQGRTARSRWTRSSCRRRSTRVT